MTGKYRAELLGYDAAIESFERLIKRHGLICLISEYILSETGIGDWDVNAGFHFPNIFREWEKETDPHYFESGVMFNCGNDPYEESWYDTLTYEEFVWLIEDACKSLLAHNSKDAETADILLERVHDKFLNKE